MEFLKKMYEKFPPTYIQRTSHSVGGGGEVCEFMERIVTISTHAIGIIECFTFEYKIYTTCRWDRRLKSYIIITYIILLLY